MLNATYRRVGTPMRTAANCRRDRKYLQPVWSADVTDVIVGATRFARTAHARFGLEVERPNYELRVALPCELVVQPKEGSRVQKFVFNGVKGQVPTSAQ